MTRRDLKAIRNALLKRLVDLQSLGPVEMPTASHAIESVDAAQAVQARETAAAEQQFRSDRIREVLVALDRLGGAGAGMCDECEREIPLARLKAKPEARLCVECQSHLEVSTKYQHASELQDVA